MTDKEKNKKSRAKKKAPISVYQNREKRDAYLQFDHNEGDFSDADPKEYEKTKKNQLG